MGLRWREQYSVGVEEIDEEHKGIIVVIEKLHRAMLSGRSRQIMTDILDELVRYAHVHFATEERLMQAAFYPGLDKHRTEHQAFLNKARVLKEQHDAGRSVLGMDVMRFLQEWLVRHILDEDQLYGPTLRGEVVHEPPVEDEAEAAEEL